MANFPCDAGVSLVKLSETGEQVFKDAFVSFRESAKSLIPAIDVKQIKAILFFSGAL